MAKNMGEVIRRLRKERDLTQEELAEQIGVTSQAVSKWENNTGLPDISQVVPLANFFGVSTDTLFDFCSEDKEREIKDYEERSLKLRNKGLNEENFVLWREALEKYPGNYTCMSNLSYALASCASQEADTIKQEMYVKEEIALCERILSGCTDPDFRSGALQLLVYAYGNNMYSFADEEKAVHYANMSCSLWVSTDILLEKAYFTEEGKKEAARIVDTNLLDFMDLISSELQYNKEGSIEEQILFCRTAITLWKILIPDDNYLFYHCRIYYLYKDIARLSARLGRREDVLEALKMAKKHAVQFDNRPEGKVYFTSPFVLHAYSDSAGCTKNYTESDYELFLNNLKDSCFDFIRDDPEFIALSK